MSSENNDDFFEEDETLEEVAKAWAEGEPGITTGSRVLSPGSEEIVQRAVEALDKIGFVAGGDGTAVNIYKKCPSCQGTNFEVRNHSLMWHDGEVWCIDCNVFVRHYDAG